MFSSLFMTAVDPIMQSSFKTKTLCIHHSTVWPVSYVTSLRESLTRIAHSHLFMIITGALDRFHKGNINCGITVFLNTDRIWCLVPPGGCGLLIMCSHQSLSCEVRVSCDLQLPRVSATNTCRIDI